MKAIKLQHFQHLKSKPFEKILIVSRSTDFKELDGKENNMSPYNAKIFRKKM